MKTLLRIIIWLMLASWAVIILTVIKTYDYISTVTNTNLTLVRTDWLKPIAEAMWYGPKWK